MLAVDALSLPTANYGANYVANCRANYGANYVANYGANYVANCRANYGANYVANCRANYVARGHLSCHASGLRPNNDDDDRVLFPPPLKSGARVPPRSPRRAGGPGLAPCPARRILAEDEELGDGDGSVTHPRRMLC